MTRTRALEIAESWVNGNVSWVKARVKSITTFLQVLEALEEIHPESVESYRRICGKN